MLLHELKADVLIALFCLCDLKDLLRIEQTCRRLRDLVSTQQVWLIHLRRLDQANAPNLPYHIDVHKLKSDELRTMVIRAVQAHENWRNGAFVRNAQNQDIYIELNDPPAAHLLLPGTIASIARSPAEYPPYAPQITLFPGGDFLLVQWTHGFVQLVNIEARKAIWTYPDLPPTRTNLINWSDNCLCYDVAFQADGYANVVVAYWKVGTDSEEAFLGLKELIIEVFRFSLANQEVSRLYSKTEHSYYPGNVNITIEGELLSIHCTGSKHHREEFSLLVLIDFVKNRSVLAKIPFTFDFMMPSNSKKIQIVQGNLFLSCFPNPSHSRPPSFSNPPLLKVLDVRHVLTAAGMDRRRSFTVSEAINIDELRLTDIYLELPEGYRAYGQVALPSLCSFHWKEERERYDQLTVEIQATEQHLARDGWFTNRYIFTPRKSSGEPPMLSLVSSSKVFPSVPSESSYEVQRLLRFIPCSLSGRSIMLYIGSNSDEDRIEVLVFTTIDETADANSSQGQTPFSFRSAPKWLSSPRTLCKLDYLSGAIIQTCEDQRWIKIAYPA